MPIWVAVHLSRDWTKQLSIYRKHIVILVFNHGMVMKREIAERHPWAILNVLKMFQKANAIAGQRRVAHVDAYFETGLLPKDAEGVVAKPLIQHGIVANRTVLETAAQYSFEQGLTPRLMKLEEVFAKATLEQ